jgi:hypothetical protein
MGEITHEKCIKILVGKPEGKRPLGTTRHHEIRDFTSSM